MPGGDVCKNRLWVEFSMPAGGAIELAVWVPGDGLEAGFSGNLLVYETPQHPRPI